MIDWGFTVGLIVIASVLIVPLVYFGRRFSKSLQMSDPDGQLSMHITPVGHVLVGCLICVWAAFMIARELAPDSWLGAAVDTGGELLAAFGLSLVVWVVVVLVLETLGHPVMKNNNRT